MEQIIADIEHTLFEMAYEMEASFWYTVLKLPQSERGYWINEWRRYEFGG